MIYGKWLRGSDDLSQALALRQEVFVQEQGFSAEAEHDALDDRAVHALLFDEEGRTVGCGRLYIDDEGYWHLGRLCVRKEQRGKQLGDLLMRMMLDKAMMAGGKHFRLGAQADKRGFYEKYGFTAVGDPYLDEGVEHYLMEADDQSVLRAVFSGCKSQA